MKDGRVGRERKSEPLTMKVKLIRVIIEKCNLRFAKFTLLGLGKEFNSQDQAVSKRLGRYRYKAKGPTTMKTSLYRAK